MTSRSLYRNQGLTEWQALLMARDQRRADYWAAASAPTKRGLLSTLLSLRFVR